LLCDFTAEQRRNRFYHDQLGARVLHGERIAQYLARAGVGLALHLEAAKRMHRLRRQTDMRAHRNRPFDQKAHCVREPFTALELHHLRAGAHQFHRAPEGVFRRAVRAERQVGHHQRRGPRPRDARRVIRDVGERHRQGGRLALQHVAERIADQQHVDARAIQQRGEARVVTGQHGDLFAGVAHCLQFRHGDGVPARFLQIGHGEIRWKKEGARRLKRRAFDKEFLAAAHGFDAFGE
jgi:hypothetical protein